MSSTVTTEYIENKWGVTIPGDPQSQKRHRHRKAGRRIITYDPSSKDKKTIEQILGMVFKKKWLYEDAVDVTIDAYFRPPKNWSKKKTQEHEGVHRPKKPDFDNIAKFYCDAMNGIVYTDDNLIVRATVRKMYSTRPRVEIWVSPHV